VILIECDNCEKTFEADDADAGGKIACPYCGDINRVPAADTDHNSGTHKSGEPIAEKKAGKKGSEPKQDRATALGLPPDSGPEQHVTSVKPVMFRAHPLLGGISVLIWLGGIVASLYYHTPWPLIATALATLFLAGWWVKKQTVKLEITNKRTIIRRGLISRSTSEVLHDHVRNIQTEQSLWGRITGIGTLGISSSGQDDIEILVTDLPNPDKLRGIIDAYRPM